MALKDAERIHVCSCNCPSRSENEINRASAHSHSSDPQPRLQSHPCQLPPGGGAQLNAHMPRGTIKPSWEKYLFSRLHPAGISLSGDDPWAQPETCWAPLLNLHLPDLGLVTSYPWQKSQVCQSHAPAPAAPCKCQVPAAGGVGGLADLHHIVLPPQEGSLSRACMHSSAAL